MDHRTDSNRLPADDTAAHAASGSYSHDHFASATELLSDEHRVIERVLAVLQKLADRPAENCIESWQQALEFCSRFADQCHHLKEEQLLFPIMEERGIPKEGGPIGVMLMEHEEGRAHVRAMRALLPAVAAKSQGAQESLIKSARAYVRLLTEHIRKEDEILFPMADGVIDAHEQKQLLRTFEQHEANEMGAGVHEKYLKIAEELEAKHP